MRAYCVSCSADQQDSASGWEGYHGENIPATLCSSLRRHRLSHSQGRRHVLFTPLKVYLEAYCLIVFYIQSTRSVPLHQHRLIYLLSDPSRRVEYCRGSFLGHSSRIADCRKGNMGSAYQLVNSVSLSRQS